MKQIIKAYRAKRILGIANAQYDAVVCSCANVSRVNHALAFVVRRSGAFGFPSVEPIPRPDVVLVEENKQYVVVKDGKIFELKTWI